MRIILKIIAAPAVLALTLIVAVLNFSVSLASWVLGILSLILAVCGLFELFIQIFSVITYCQNKLIRHRAGACFSAFSFRAARRSRVAGLQAG